MRELDDPMGQADVLQSLAVIAGEGGRHGRAFDLLAEAADALMSIRYVSGLIEVIDSFAAALVRVGRPDAAARLWGARDALGGEIGRDRAHPLEAAAHDSPLLRPCRSRR